MNDPGGERSMPDEFEDGFQALGWGPLLAQLAGAADLCLRPRRHAVRFHATPPGDPGEASDLCLLIEARDPDGCRAPSADLDLEIYRSGSTINLMLGRREPESAPLLWQGQHPVWMDASTGARCASPEDGAPLEALARRIRALISLESQ